MVTLVVERDTKGGGDWIEMQIQDTGIGIAEADIAKLFKNYEQATALTESKFGGTGLGLALSQRLSAIMGGGITVESQLGSGSCFTLRLPATLAAEHAETTQAELEQALQAA